MSRFLGLMMVLAPVTILSGCEFSSRDVVQVSIGEAATSSNDTARCQIDQIPDRSPNILLITVDTLRADHLGVYGYPRETSPSVDDLARNGVLFEKAFVPLPKTTPSLVSILTGLHPHTHRVYRLGERIDDSLVLLSTVLESKGYDTGAVCGQFNCTSKLGFGRGFQFFDEINPPPGWQELPNTGGGFHPESERRASHIVDTAVEWLDQRADASAPFFLWLHFMDPHAGYSAPGEFGDFFTGSSPYSNNNASGQTIPVSLIHQQAYVQGQTDYDFYQNRYDGEIRYLDEELGRLLEFMRGLGIYDETVIVFTADHGEYMGEAHEELMYFNHGSTLYQSEIHVPLVVKLSGDQYAGSAVSCPVSVVDIFPTILDLVGLEEQYHQGCNLLSYAIAARGEDCRYQFAVKVEDGDAIAVIGERAKLVLRTTLGVEEMIRELESGRELDLGYQLHDYVEDPLERTALGLTNTRELESMVSALSSWIARRGDCPGYYSTPLTDEETLEHLKALGYVN